MWAILAFCNTKKAAVNFFVIDFYLKLCRKAGVVGAIASSPRTWSTRIPICRGAYLPLRTADLQFVSHYYSCPYCHDLSDTQMQLRIQNSI